MSSANLVNKPSDYLDAMEATFASLLNAEKDKFDVYDYGDFGRIDITRPTILLEYYKAPGDNRMSDGRLYEDLEVWVHCVFPASVKQAERKAADLSFEMRSKVICDVPSTNDPEEIRYPRWNWGLAPGTVHRPTNIDRQPSLFKDGDKGYEAWAVTFIQRVIYGSVDDTQETREGISFAVNDDVDNPDSYKEIES